VGDRVGADVGLDLAVPLCLVALVGPRVKRWTDMNVVAAAGLVAALAERWPSASGLLLAIGVGTAVGGLTDRGRR
jgi:predicted branched-subunit amino acid permease